MSSDMTRCILADHWSSRKKRLRNRQVTFNHPNFTGNLRKIVLVQTNISRWIEATVYYLLRSLWLSPEDAHSIWQVRSMFALPEIKADLAFVKFNFSIKVETLKNLQYQGSDDDYCFSKMQQLLAGLAPLDDTDWAKFLAVLKKMSERDSFVKFK